ncbi:MAG TPA: 30S ribosomal protein S20 [bacterium]|nr:30S ribosomal protein S20 [bacterium]HPR87620.1 30S ribosomal protein S20 [bacterium]
MANHKSAVKRIQTNARDTERNKAYKNTLRTFVKKVRAVSSKEEGEKLFRSTASLLDKLAKKGIIHKNKAANQKSRLAAIVNKLS